MIVQYFVIKCEILMFSRSFRSISLRVQKLVTRGNKLKTFTSSELERSVCWPVWAEVQWPDKVPPRHCAPPSLFIVEYMYVPMTSPQLYFLTGSSCTITVVVVLRSYLTKIACEQEALLVFLNLAVLSERPQSWTDDFPNSSQTVDDEASQTRLWSLFCNKYYFPINQYFYLIVLLY